MVVGWSAIRTVRRPLTSESRVIHSEQPIGKRCATKQESVRIFSHFCIADPEDSTPLRDLSELVVFNSTAAQPLDRSERRATPECIRLLPQPRSAARQRQNM
jgi:hypothetical protein